MRMFRLLLWLLWAAFAASTAHAAASPEPSDHPLLSRIPGFEVHSKTGPRFDVVKIEDFNIAGQIGKNSQAFQAEGKVTFIDYNDDKETTSPAFIYRNYLSAAKSLGGVQLNSNFGPTSRDVQGGHHIFQIPSKSVAEPTYVLLRINGSRRYSLTFIEPSPMVQQVTVGKLAQEMADQGFATIRLNFATGSAEVPPDAAQTLQTIVQWLKQTPSLHLSIEGHTDNVGQAADNKRLSQARADAVRSALLAQGIAAGRLTAKGWGQEQPIADNRADAGRAQNRRVELVKSP